MCECRLSCYCTRWRVEKNLYSSWQNAGQDTQKEAALDWISHRIRGHGRRRKLRCLCSWHGLDPILHGFSELVSQRKWGHLSLVELTYPFWIWGICFPHCNDFSLVSSCWNSITPFSNNVNIVQLLFFSSLPRGDSLFLSEEAHTLGKTAGQIKRNGGIHSQQKQCVVLKLWTEILEILQKDHWILHWPRTTF